MAKANKKGFGSVEDLITVYNREDGYRHNGKIWTRGYNADDWADCVRFCSTRKMKLWILGEAAEFRHDTHGKFSDNSLFDEANRMRGNQYTGTLVGTVTDGKSQRIYVWEPTLQKLEKLADNPQIKEWYSRVKAAKEAAYIRSVFNRPDFFSSAIPTDYDRRCKAIGGFFIRAEVKDPLFLQIKKFADKTGRTFVIPERTTSSDYKPIILELDCQSDHKGLSEYSEHEIVNCLMSKVAARKDSMYRETVMNANRFGDNRLLAHLTFGNHQVPTGEMYIRPVILAGKADAVGNARGNIAIYLNGGFDGRYCSCRGVRDQN